MCGRILSFDSFSVNIQHIGGLARGFDHPAFERGRASRRIGHPPVPSSKATPSNLSSLLLAKFSDSSIWFSASTFTAKSVCRAYAAKLLVFLPRQNSTSGGSSDTEQNELMVTPSAWPAGVRVVMTHTPLSRSGRGRVERRWDPPSRYRFQEQGSGEVRNTLTCAV